MSGRYALTLTWKIAAKPWRPAKIITESMRFNSLSDARRLARFYWNQGQAAKVHRWSRSLRKDDNDRT